MSLKVVGSIAAVAIASVCAIVVLWLSFGGLLILWMASWGSRQGEYSGPGTETRHYIPVAEHADSRPATHPGGR